MTFSVRDPRQNPAGTLSVHTPLPPSLLSVRALSVSPPTRASVCPPARAAPGITAMMDNDEHTGPFNIGNPTEFTMLELANVVKEVVNPDAVIEFRENTADDPARRKPNIDLVSHRLAPGRPIFFCFSMFFW
jgi:hypothetical protein